MAKHKIGDTFYHKKFGFCEVIEVDELWDNYEVKLSNGTKKVLSISFVDEFPKKTEKLSYIKNNLPIVSATYRKSNGNYDSKEYFFFDGTNDKLKVGDIGLAYTRRSNRCVPAKITNINISEDDIKKLGVNIKDLVTIRYKGTEDYFKED